jgi:4-amino-4-deoxychorismate lyase
MAFLETIRIEDGKAAHLSYHQARLEATLQAYRLHVHYDLAALIAPPSSGLLRCRALYDATSITFSYTPYVPRTFDALYAVYDDTIAYPYKTTDREHLNQLFDRRHDQADVAIIKKGFLRDTTIANIALFDGRRWVTPSNPLLHGTARARLIEEGFLLEKPIPAAAIPTYEKVAIMNAMIGFVEVTHGIILPT